MPTVHEQAFPKVLLLIQTRPGIQDEPPNKERKLTELSKLLLGKWNVFSLWISVSNWCLINIFFDVPWKRPTIYNYFRELQEMHKDTLRFVNNAKRISETWESSGGIQCFFPGAAIYRSRGLDRGTIGRFQWNICKGHNHNAKVPFHHPTINFITIQTNEYECDNDGGVGGGETSLRQPHPPCTIDLSVKII